MDLFIQRPEPLPGYRFRVFIQAVSMGFSKISNFEKSVETEGIIEGGVNDHVTILFKPVSAERTISFERGVAYRGIAISSLSLFFSVGRRLWQDITVMVYGRAGSIEKMFLVKGAVVKRWHCSDLDAMSGELLVEQFEVSYEQLEELPYEAIAMLKGIF